MVKCVAIDDEPLALEIIEKFCRRLGGIELACFVDPVEGLAAIHATHPQIVFLDIEMENMSGLAVASKLPADTCFIFTTAYLNYALEGYNLDAVDYLHKPFAFSRFQMAFAKAMRRMGSTALQTPAQSIVVKQEYNNVSIPLDDILYIEAMEGYSKIHRATGGCTVSRVILKNLCSMLPAAEFVRIHRSYVVPRSKVKSFNKQEVCLYSGAVLPVGRQYAADMVEILGSRQ
ncbi:MAG: LytTR family DNA-binding domain-containing protein [Muribaculaceae bacterium]|nr:LytTR family DNA-binding domain-containing protein [Muribaculaceae bacterium]